MAAAAHRFQAHLQLAAAAEQSAAQGSPATVCPLHPLCPLQRAVPRSWEAWQAHHLARLQCPAGMRSQQWIQSMPSPSLLLVLQEQHPLAASNLCVRRGRLEPSSKCACRSGAGSVGGQRRRGRFSQAVRSQGRSPHIKAQIHGCEPIEFKAGWRSCRAPCAGWWPTSSSLFKQVGARHTSCMRDWTPSCSRQ